MTISSWQFCPAWGFFSDVFCLDPINQGPFTEAFSLVHRRKRFFLIAPSPTFSRRLFPADHPGRRSYLDSKNFKGLVLHPSTFPRPTGSLRRLSLPFFKSSILGSYIDFTSLPKLFFDPPKISFLLLSLSLVEFSPRETPCGIRPLSSVLWFPSCPYFS